MSIKADLLSDGASRSRQYHVLLSESDGASRRHVGCRTALRAVVPMSGVGQNLLQIRGGLFFTLLISETQNGAHLYE